MSFPLPLALAFALIALNFVCLILLWIKVRRQARRQEATESDGERLGQQQAIMQETLRTMGRQIVQQERKLGGLADFAPAPLPVGTDSESILQMLEEGRSVEEIVEATGLDEVEITLLRQIRESQTAET